MPPPPAAPPRVPRALRRLGRRLPIRRRRPDAPPAAASPPRPSRPAGVAPTPAGTGRKVARLISAKAAESVIKPAADGRLPDLHLQESGKQPATEGPSRSVHPLVLYGVLTLCAVISFLMLLGPSDLGSSGEDNSAEKEAARQNIERKFFGGGNLDSGELKPFQNELHAAKRAHDSGDTKSEYDHYDKVLRMLHAEHGPDDRPLTGDGEKGRESDRELKMYIETILKGT